MLPFSGQGANQGIEDAGAISALFRDVTSKDDITRRLALFEEVRVKRALRVQTLSKVRSGREREVAGEIGEFLEDGMVGMFTVGCVERKGILMMFLAPDTLNDRLVHDTKYVILSCN